jgi:hypothetical protein
LFQLSTSRPSLCQSVPRRSCVGIQRYTSVLATFLSMFAEGFAVSHCVKLLDTAPSGQRQTGSPGSTSVQATSATSAAATAGAPTTATIAGLSTALARRRHTRVGRSSAHANHGSLLDAPSRPKASKSISKDRLKSAEAVKRRHYVRPFPKPILHECELMVLLHHTSWPDGFHLWSRSRRARLKTSRHGDGSGTACQAAARR